MTHKKTARLAALALATALVGGGIVAVGTPAAVADSRCSTSSHTHGALFWERTDRYLGKFKNTQLKVWSYQHENSNPVNCGKY